MAQLDSQNSYPTDDSSEELIVELRDPAWAALLAWLWPGAGHIYQRRYSKGILYMVCILGTFYYGLAISGGHAVYAAWRPNDHRWQYACQLGAGANAFPAIVQAIHVKDGKNSPYFVTHVLDKNVFTEEDKDREKGVVKLGVMAPPPGPVVPDQKDALAFLHERYKHNFDLGTLFTLVAGLLNILAVYDAFAGPAFPMSEEEEEEDELPEDPNPETK